MFFSGINTKVTLINVPAWDANLIRTTTLPIRKHTITVKADGYSGRGGSISFFDYESGALIEYNNANSEQHLDLSGILQFSLNFH